MTIGYLSFHLSTKISSSDAAKSLVLALYNQERVKEILAAMLRYMEAGKDIPGEWRGELMGLLNDIRRIKAEVPPNAYSIDSGHSFQSKPATDST